MKVHLTRAIVGAGRKNEIVEVDNAYGERLIAGGHADPVDDRLVDVAVVPEGADGEQAILDSVDNGTDTVGDSSDPEIDGDPEIVDPERTVKRTPRKTTAS